HGGTYSERDYSFALSADGGTGTQGEFAGTSIQSKYPPSIYPQRPIGGFGGMGLIQLHVPPGDDADGTGCAFDDHIRFLDVDANGFPFEVSAARKTALLGWRGWAQPDGTRVDDRGRVLARLEGEGDMRPSPILLPLPFDTVTRARSRWIDLGGVARRRVDEAPGPGVPGVVVTDPQNAPLPDLGDPQLGFADIHADGPHAGFLTWDQSGEHRPAVVTIDGLDERAVLAARTGASFDGRPSYHVDLDMPLGGERDRYAGYRLLLIGRFGESRGEFRILAHDGTSVELAPDGAFPASGIRARVIARFAGALSNGGATLGRTRPGSPPGTREPRANLRFGFAFTTDPHGDPITQRWPAWDGRGMPGFARPGVPRLAADASGALRPLGHHLVPRLRRVAARAPRSCAARRSAAVTRTRLARAAVPVLTSAARRVRALWPGLRRLIYGRSRLLHDVVFVRPRRPRVLVVTDRSGRAAGPPPRDRPASRARSGPSPRRHAHPPLPRASGRPDLEELPPPLIRLRTRR
ncbi:MAG: hypothetical protein HZB39_09310, partial [Planctomycetes bacterium]|nr:hypothetical protein [Planctomycetota bacterium]